ncbi:MAG: DUF922 domain-containing protein, partial [Gillisia sp.]
QNPHQLSWNDFRGKPKSRSGFNANTNSGISYGYKISGTPATPFLDYKVIANFYPGLSWVNPESKTTDLLQHEQLHFDISELYARKLRKSLSELSPEKLKGDPRKILNSLYEKLEEQRVATEVKFDVESLHSLNKAEEKKWEDSIHRELQELEEFQITD